MYIELGQNVVVSDKDIIGIFDLDTSTVSKKTRDTLNRAETEENIVTVSLYELPRSFTVSAKNKNGHKIIISPLSVNAVLSKTMLTNRGTDPKETNK